MFLPYTMFRSCLAIVLCIVTTVLSAQQYTRKQYKIEHGLPSDLIKAITQDSLGNLWIATDEGFVMYNASRFETFRNATHSNYTKGFHHTRDGKLIAFGDLDVLELNSKIDSISFVSMVPVSLTINDSSLHYPKLLYESHDGATWASESQSVVRLRSGQLRRYTFDLADRTPQFLRSFQFFEDGNGNLFTVSVAGNVFQYDVDTDQFVRTDFKFPEQVEFVEVIKDQLLIGAKTGLYGARKDASGKFEQPKLLSDIRYVSYVAALKNGNYFVATRGSDHFTVDNTFKNKTNVVSDVNNINHIYISKENDIWLSTHEGILFMQEAAFQGPTGKSNGFIESIHEDKNSSLVYYATSQELHAIDNETNEDKTLINNITDSYFQAIVTTRKGTWAANAFKVLLINGNKITKTFDFSDERLFVTALTVDVQDNVWLTIPGRPGILMIDNNLQLHNYKIPLASDGFVNAIEDTDEGIYVVSKGNDYLFFKSNTDTAFRNISIPVELKRKEELNTFSIFIKGQTIWLATSLGLLRYDHEKIERVDMGIGYAGVPIRSMFANDDRGFLIATPKELLYYNIENGDCSLFASSLHLSGLTVNAKSLMISRDKRVWIGTSRGVFISSQRIDDKIKTLQPQLAYANADGKPIAHLANTIFPHNILLSLGVTSVTFPEEERVFEFRRSEDQPWTRLSGTSVDIITSNSGDQQIQIRARKTGTYEWSDATNIYFDVLRPFWMTGGFYFLVTMAIVFIIGVTAVIVKSLDLKQKSRLEAMVNDRTAQLGEANHELEAFSYSVSHDLRAPLRTILAYSQMLEEDYATQIDDEGRKNIAAVQRSANKMNQLIDDLLRFSRILHQGLSISNVDLNAMVYETISGLKEQGHENTIVHVPSLPVVAADRGLLQQVWSNLISNAMKYSSKAQQPQVDISYEEKGKEFLFKVKDNGAGFDMKYADKLFGVFQRLHSEKEFHGTGIGLALVKRIVTRHGGKIWAEGKVKEGATFFFTLPKQNQ